MQDSLRAPARFLGALLDVWRLRRRRQRSHARGGLSEALGGGAVESLNMDQGQLRVLVVGAGPAGLVGAVTAYVSGAHVELVEQQHGDGEEGGGEHVEQAEHAELAGTWIDLAAERDVLGPWGATAADPDTGAGYRLG